MVYRTDAFRDWEVVRPWDNPPAVGLLGEPRGLGRIGIAYPVSWIAADEEVGRPAETLWRLVVGEVARCRDGSCSDTGSFAACQAQRLTVWSDNKARVW